MEFASRPSKFMPSAPLCTPGLLLPEEKCLSAFSGCKPRQGPSVLSLRVGSPKLPQILTEVSRCGAGITELGKSSNVDRYSLVSRVYLAPNLRC